tara:strand:+ start:48275 stop:49363 length:1089 start_codon:yes stop_codon:yes gene_type:complete
MKEYMMMMVGDINLSLFHIFVLFGFILFVIILVITFYKPKKNPQTHTLYTDALNAMVKADRTTALRLLRDVVKQDSDHVNAYLQLGNILRDENPEQAAKIHQSLTVRPNLPSQVQLDIHQSLARDYEKLGKLDLARLEGEQILRLDKKNIWAVEFLLKLAEGSKDWASASEFAKKLQRLKNNKELKYSAQFDLYKGLQFIKENNNKDALVHLNKAVKIAPDFGLPYKHIGDIYEISRDLLKAVDNWELYAIKAPKDAPKVFSKIESALFDLGLYSEVENFYRRILDNDPKNFDAIIHLANVLEEKGEANAALNLVEETLKFDKLDLRSSLMKIKLSLTTSTPIELSRQIDHIIDKLHENENT